MINWPPRNVEELILWLSTLDPKIAVEVDTSTGTTVVDIYNDPEEPITTW